MTKMIAPRMTRDEEKCEIKRIADRRVSNLSALRDYRLLSLIWHNLEDEEGRKAHSAVASCRDVFCYPDLRSKFAKLVREAVARDLSRPLRKKASGELAKIQADIARGTGTND